MNSRRGVRRRPHRSRCRAPGIAWRWQLPHQPYPTAAHPLRPRAVETAPTAVRRAGRWGAPQSLLRNTAKRRRVQKKITHLGGFGYMGLHHLRAAGSTRLVVPVHEPDEAAARDPGNRAIPKWSNSAGISWPYPDKKPVPLQLGCGGEGGEFRYPYIK